MIGQSLSMPEYYGINLTPSQDGSLEQLLLEDIDSIRLLRLKPHKDDDVTAIEAELYVSKLSEVERRYDALSYTWNSEKRTRQIKINGVDILIGQNLHDFLIRLRENGMTTPLWADAICINQYSNEEKNHQVRQMGKIYSSAKCTRTWLGEGSSDLAELMTIYNERGALQWNTKPLSELSMDMNSVLDSLLKHSYWTRTWIVQEILLASEIIVHCQSQQLIWDNFMTVTRRICAKVGPSCLSKYGTSKMKQLDAQISNGTSRALPGLLAEYQNTKCADIRDRVFAMIGLIDAEDDPLFQVSDSTTEQPQSRSHILDYTIALPELFVRLLRLYASRAPDTFLTSLWNALGLHSYLLTEEQRSTSVELFVRYQLIFDTLPLDSGNFASARFDDTRSGTWAWIEFPWCINNRPTFWRLPGQPFETISSRTGLLLGVAVSWNNWDGCGNLTKIAEECCHAAHSTTISPLYFDGPTDDWIAASFELGYLKLILEFGRYRRTLTKHISATDSISPVSLDLQLDGVQRCFVSLGAEAGNFEETVVRMIGSCKLRAGYGIVEDPGLAWVAEQNLKALRDWIGALLRDLRVFESDTEQGKPAPEGFESWEAFAAGLLERCYTFQKWRVDDFHKYRHPYKEVKNFPFSTRADVTDLVGREERLELDKILNSDVFKSTISPDPDTCARSSDGSLAMPSPPPNVEGKRNVSVRQMNSKPRMKSVKNLIRFRGCKSSRSNTPR